MERFKEKIWAQLFVIYTRYLIGGTFVFASLIKIKGKRFTSESGASNPIDSAWHFFETLYQSGLYWQFIGVSQLVAGFLLMTQRYSKLGALVFFPISLNIFVITLSYYFAYTPVVTGLMLLANLMLLAWDWNVLKVLFNLKPSFDTRNRMEHDRLWQVVGLLMFLFTFLYRVFVDRYNIFVWLIVCFALGLFGMIYGLVRARRRRALNRR